MSIPNLSALQEEVSLHPGQAFEHYRAYMNRSGVTRAQRPDSGRHDATWHRLERRHLHPHYSVSILDDTINRQNDFLQAAINRAIAGAFMGVGESAVASNIVNVTHRIQRWDFRQCTMPPVLDRKYQLIGVWEMAEVILLVYFLNSFYELISWEFTVN